MCFLPKAGRLIISVRLLPKASEYPFAPTEPNEVIENAVMEIIIIIADMTVV